jgi:hypothetical protein
VSSVKCSQLLSNSKYGDIAASRRAHGDTSRATGKRTVEDDLLRKVTEEIFASSFRNSDDINGAEVNDSEGAPEDLMWIDDQVATHATAAAKLMRSAFGDPMKNRGDGTGRRDFKGVGERVECRGRDSSIMCDFSSQQLDSRICRIPLCVTAEYVMFLFVCPSAVCFRRGWVGCRHFSGQDDHDAGPDGTLCYVT